MKMFRKTQYWLTLFQSLLIGASPYISLEHKEIYSLVEYSILDSENKTSLFIANQPYTLKEVKSLFEEQTQYLYYVKKSTYYREDPIRIHIQPGINYINNHHIF